MKKTISVRIMEFIIKKYTYFVVMLCLLAAISMIMIGINSKETFHETIVINGNDTISIHWTATYDYESQHFLYKDRVSDINNQLEFTIGDFLGDIFDSYTTNSNRVSSLTISMTEFFMVDDCDQYLEFQQLDCNFISDIIKSDYDKDELIVLNNFKIVINKIVIK